MSKKQNQKPNKTPELAKDLSVYLNVISQSSQNTNFEVRFLFQTSKIWKNK